MIIKYTNFCEDEENLKTYPQFRHINFILSLPLYYILDAISILMSVDKNSRIYPNRLQTFRKSAGLKQQHVAILLGLNNPASLSDWENYKQMPNGTNLIKLCIIYNKTPEELYPEYFQELLFGYLNTHN